MKVRLQLPQKNKAEVKKNFGFWQGQKDLILARTARSVFHGRGRPPEVRSVPFPLQVHLPTVKEKGTDRLRDLFLFLWQGQKDLNPRPMVLETSTLPTELYPYIRIILYQNVFALSRCF